ncbi:hypothetical protein BC829DRAFT_385977 [Chytridium lagenaria]|nr:hypothetical protein BC829DRAFT_385977 [Chytridium lagenaria]
MAPMLFARPSSPSSTSMDSLSSSSTSPATATSSPSTQSPSMQQLQPPSPASPQPAKKKRLTLQSLSSLLNSKKHQTSTTPRQTPSTLPVKSSNSFTPLTLSLNNPILPQPQPPAPIASVVEPTPTDDSIRLPKTPPSSTPPNQSTSPPNSPSTSPQPTDRRSSLRIVTTGSDNEEEDDEEVWEDSDDEECDDRASPETDDSSDTLAAPERNGVPMMVMGRRRAYFDPIQLAFLTTCKLNQERVNPMNDTRRVILMQNMLKGIYGSWADLLPASGTTAPATDEDEEELSSEEEEDDYEDAVYEGDDNVDERKPDLTVDLSQSRRVVDQFLSAVDGNVSPTASAYANCEEVGGVAMRRSLEGTRKVLPVSVGGVVGVKRVVVEDEDDDVPLGEIAARQSGDLKRSASIDRPSAAVEALAGDAIKPVALKPVTAVTLSNKLSNVPALSPPTPVIDSPPPLSKTTSSISTLSTSPTLHTRSSTSSSLRTSTDTPPLVRKRTSFTSLLFGRRKPVASFPVRTTPTVDKETRARKSHSASEADARHWAMEAAKLEQGGGVYSVRHPAIKTVEPKEMDEEEWEMETVTMSPVEEKRRRSVRTVSTHSDPSTLAGIEEEEEEEGPRCPRNSRVGEVWEFFSDEEIRQMSGMLRLAEASPVDVPPTPVVTKKTTRRNSLKLDIPERSSSKVWVAGWSAPAAPVHANLREKGLLDEIAEAHDGFRESEERRAKRENVSLDEVFRIGWRIELGSELKTSFL